MEHKNEHNDAQQSTFDLIKNEIENFRLGKTPHSPCKKSSSSSCPCAGNTLAEKLVKILEDDKTETTKKSWLMEKVMADSVVFREVLSKMDAQSLLQFRQVSRLWRGEATSLLLSKRHQTRNQEFLCVKFKGFALQRDIRHNTGKNLEEFVEESAGNPQMLIYTGLIFEGGNSYGTRSNSSLTQFFSQHGRHIQHLNLSLETLEVVMCREILSQWTPNLKSLVLDPGTWAIKMHFEGEVQRPLRPFVLPKLRKITLPTLGEQVFGQGPANNLIQEILTSAPNLTCIENPNLGHFTQVEAAGKVSLLETSVTWTFPYRAGNETNLTNFVATGPKLTSLTLQGETSSRSYPQTFPAFLNLLDLGQTTLKKVTGIQILGQNYNPPLQVQISPFPNLTELDLTTDGAANCLHESSTILPPGHDLSEIVPNLKILGLRGTKKDPFTYPFTSEANAHAALKQLKISISAPHLTIAHMRQWVETLGGHYPNITHLSISIQHKGEENFPECLKLIPRYFKNLEQLVLRLWVENSSDQPKAEWNFDAALTGFSKETLDGLRKQEEPDPEYQKVEALEHIRTYSSILDLKTDLFEIYDGGIRKVAAILESCNSTLCFSAHGKKTRPSS